MTYKMVSIAEGLEIAKNNPDAIIVDVRRDDEYKTGHIPGAVLLTKETITAETAAKVLPDKNQMILIYCRSGRRSKIAAQTLLELGYTNLMIRSLKVQDFQRHSSLFIEFSAGSCRFL